MKHIGLFFGTFDPLHNGHVAIAKYFISELKLEELWLVVTPMNPFKEHAKVSNENKRLEMVSCFCDSNEKIICTDVEFHLPKPNYTADTLDYLVKKNSKTKFFVIMGEDNLNTLHLWKNYQDILKQQICVYPRESVTKLSKSLSNHPNVKLYNAPIMDVSSTIIRKKISEDKPIDYLVPNEIVQFLTQY